MMNTSSVEPPFNEEKNTTEYTDYYDDIPVYELNSFHALTPVSCLCGLVGNGVVIWLLSFCIKRNPFTTYILNLAVADFGTLLSLFVRVTLLYSRSYSALDFLVPFLCFTYSASVYFLTAISLERCLSVLFPIWYRCHRPERSSAVVCFLLWIIPALLSATLVEVFDDWYTEHHFTLQSTIFTVNLLIFTPIMVVSTLIMSIKICCSSQRRQPPRLYVTILVTLLFFLIFAVPLSATYFIVLNTEIDFYIDFECCLFFATLNSSINPIIYYFVGRDRKKNREPLKVVLKRAFRDEATCQGGT